MTLGERLCKLRKEKGLSQEEAADKINVTRQTISKWELDQSLPDFDKIVPICKLYGITSDELLNGTTEKDNEYEDSINSKLALEVRSKRAKIISVSLILFVLSLIWVIAVDELFENSTDVLIVAGFFILCTLGVVNMIIGFASLPKLKEKECTKDCCTGESKKERPIDKIMALSFLILYLVVSFTTHAWHITWIIWIIFALVKQIVHLLLGIEEKEDD